MYCCHGNQLIGGVFGQKHDQRGNFLFFSDFGQMMLKRCRNIQWAEIL